MGDQFAENRLPFRSALGEFTVDVASIELASNVASTLRGELEKRGADLGRYWVYELWADLTSPLTLEGVPSEDIRTDVEDFSRVSLFARSNGFSVPALRIGRDGPLLPVLPQHEILARTLQEDQTYHLPFGERGRPKFSWDQANDAFFRGLRAYLAIRIAGVPWLRGRVPRAYAGGGAGSAGQSWTAHTRASGLSLYYAGTHAVRNPPNYLGGFTTPLQVFLPVGTVYIGANARPSGGVIWDSSIVIVPSVNPVFTTRRF